MSEEFNMTELFAEQFKQKNKSMYDYLINEQRAADAANAGSERVANMGLQSIGGGVNKYDIARPDYASTLTADGQLDPRFQQSLSETGQYIKDQSMMEGPSKWAQLQNQVNQNTYQSGMSDLSAQNAGQLANARASMAMRGGLGSGASERMAMSSMQNGLMGQQGLGSQLASQNLQTGIQDQTYKNQGLAATAAAEQGIGNANVAALTSGVNDMNTYNQNIYSEDMKAHAAIKSAEAQAGASSGGK